MLGLRQNCPSKVTDLIDKAHKFCQHIDDTEVEVLDVELRKFRLCIIDEVPIVWFDSCE